jgi:hypothetical protein
VDFGWIQPWNVIASFLLTFIGTAIKKGWFTSARRGLGDRIRWEQTNLAKDMRIRSLEGELEDLIRDVETRADRAKRVATAIGYEDSSSDQKHKTILERYDRESEGPRTTSTISTES